MFVSDKLTKYTADIVKINYKELEQIIVAASTMIKDLTIVEEGKGHYCAGNEKLNIKVWGPTPEEAVMNYHRALLAGALRVKLSERTT